MGPSRKGAVQARLFLLVLGSNRIGQARQRNAVRWEYHCVRAEDRRSRWPCFALRQAETTCGRRHFHDSNCSTRGISESHLCDEMAMNRQIFGETCFSAVFFSFLFVCPSILGNGSSDHEFLTLSVGSFAAIKTLLRTEEQGYG